MHTMDTLEVLSQIVKEEVQKMDDEGHADIYKKCTDLFVEHLNDFEKFAYSPVHISQIENHDSYFIFAHGTNSIASFRIDECPGWLFGIWWEKPKEKLNEVLGEFFAQYEETIDKFKPSRSEIRAQVIANADKSYCHAYEAAENIAFIRDEPYLAFCRDYCYWNYNTEFHTREEAEAEYVAFREQQENKKKYTKIMDNKILQFIKDKILPCFNNASIHDSGSGWSPRYSVVAPFEDNTDVVSEPGCYDWFDKDDEGGQKILSEFKALKAEAYEYSNMYGFIYFSPIDDYINFYRKENAE